MWSPKKVEVVDKVVVPDVAQLGVARAGEFEDDSIGLVNAETPDFVVFRVEFFSPERRVEWIISKQVGSSGCFLSNLSRQLAEQAIKRGGGRYFDHRRSIDQFAQRFSFSDLS